MRADSLGLQHIRNHRETRVAGLAPRINVFVGPNGAGKTTILEALSLATLTKSFNTSSDVALVAEGSTSLQIDARFESDLGVSTRVMVDLQVGPPMKKTLTVNNERLRAASDLIGRAPVVVLTPDDKIITSGPPAERRRFMNVVLSQASRSYLEHELEFKRALKQRNAILTEAKQFRRSLADIRPLVEPWTEMVIHHAARVIERRARFTEEFRPHLTESYGLVSENRESPDLAYQPMGLDNAGLSELGAEGFLRQQLQVVQQDELRRGVSLVGAHRDDLMLYINGHSPARDHASQGQHKTLLVAMKLAEFRYLKEASGETPMLLLDDVFSELDQSRAARLLELAEDGGFGQTFVTSTDKTIFERSLSFEGGEHRLFEVIEGEVREHL